MTDPTTPSTVPGAVSLDKGGSTPLAAEPVTEPAAPATEPAAPARAGRPGRGGRLAALAAVLVVTLGLAAVAALLVLRSQDAREVASYYRPSSAPMSAARDAGRLLFSYDHRTIDEDFAAAEALTTGGFAKEYAQTTQAVVRPVAVENKAVVEATAVAQGIAQAEPGRVVALVFVNQSTTSTKVTGQKVDQSRVRMTLVERGDRWLVSKVEAL